MVRQSDKNPIITRQICAWLRHQGRQLRNEVQRRRAAQAARIRNESPKDLDRTITEMEEEIVPY